MLLSSMKNPFKPYFSDWDLHGFLPLSLFFLLFKGCLQKLQMRIGAATEMKNLEMEWTICKEKLAGDGKKSFAKRRRKKVSSFRFCNVALCICIPPNFSHLETVLHLFVVVWFTITYLTASCKNAKFQRKDFCKDPVAMNWHYGIQIELLGMHLFLPTNMAK